MTAFKALTIFSVHLLDLVDILPALDDIVIECVAMYDRSEFGSWKGSVWTKKRTICYQSYEV